MMLVSVTVSCQKWPPAPPAFAHSSEKSPCRVSFARGSNGYLGTLTIGFKRDNSWIEPTLRYTAHDLAGAAANDDDPGRVRPGANVSGASLHNFLTYTMAWNALSATEQDAFKKRMPFYRTGATEPTINGYLINDRIYSAGGRALNRASVRSY